ncbi:MAG: carboxylate-amine ligase [Chloroherpetonaceae bacterium]|nr:carboxylate-amine ligase [Chloroherpetonaceae bacterium]MDW8437347.1 carboxylate-amine ligase [Chloroherpetonaceae bacterium]
MQQKEKFTIGIEEEYQIVDPVTRELKSQIQQILAEDGSKILKERVKPEMHQSVVEVGTGICANIQEARADLVNLRTDLARLAIRKGFRIVAASTHPFSDWKLQDITDHERYRGLVNDLQDIARANLIFGLHVHIGIADKEAQIEVMNQMRYLLPHILALTTSSPFWLGRPTGLYSWRTQVFKSFPRTGIPDIFHSYSEFDDYVKLLIKTGCIDNGKKIWWDIRPHPFFDTIEIRICDIPTRVDESIAVAALIQATAKTLYDLYRRNMQFKGYSRALIEENKFLAARYGLTGQLIDFSKKQKINTPDLILELLRFVDNAVEELESRHEINTIYKILEHGTSARKQLEVYQKTGDIKAVVDFLIRETLHGLPVQLPEDIAPQPARA